MSLLLALLVAALFAVGVYLLLDRVLVRIVLGLTLIAYGANLLLVLSGGGPGTAPFVFADRGTDDFADPLPQALALTAIVISFGLTVFLLALAYRSWVLTGADAVENDLEDRRIARLRRETDADTDRLTDELDALEADEPTPREPEP